MVKKTGRNILPPGPGRPKGVPNKLTKLLKDMILEALSEEGGVKYLRKQAKMRNPAAFMALIGKVLPMQIEHSGKDGAPIRIITGVPREPKK